MTFAFEIVFSLAFAALWWWLLGKPAPPTPPTAVATTNAGGGATNANKAVKLVATAEDDSIRATVETPAAATGVLTNSELTPQTYTVHEGVIPQHNNVTIVPSTIKKKAPLHGACHNATTPGPTRKQLNFQLTLGKE